MSGGSEKKAQESSGRPYNSDAAMAIATELGYDIHPMHLRIILEWAYDNR